MMLYNKYRPISFVDVVSNEETINALRFQVVKSKGNQYVLAGQRGTGKTTIAKILARALMCEDLKDGEPCNNCHSCIKALSGQHPDIVELDGASNNGVNNIREIIESLSYPAINGGYRVFIIDEVHMLSQGAFNALLKTVEEPPEKVVFIFATTEFDKIPATIISRCQTFSFCKISEELIAERVGYVAEKEGIDIEAEALRLIASASDGALRDALSILEQLSCHELITSSVVIESLGLIDQSMVSNFLDALYRADMEKALDLYYSITETRTPLQLLNGVIKWISENIMKKECIKRSTELLKGLLPIKKNPKELDILLALYIVEVCEANGKEKALEVGKLSSVKGEDKVSGLVNAHKSECQVGSSSEEILADKGEKVGDLKKCQAASNKDVGVLIDDVLAKLSAFGK